ncbi:VOC family protein [Streptomyces mutabilis]|uniref:Glyoxalase n=1 Tax=Streptomyces mutabilis TaxID=67332 RepID=A0A086N8E3_9ACTN|nr:VOC family protein [Streptomyces mutabilis]KFG77411.1 glyoxalase [Streptomyces mutabilis]
MTATSTLRTGHIGLNVTDIDRSLTFYGQLLGFDVLGERKDEDRRFAFLGRNGELTLTLWQQADDAYAPARAGLHHLAFQVETMEQVRAAEAALTAHGVDFAYEGVVAHEEGASSGGIFFRDPDGTRLEIYAADGAEGAQAAAVEGPACGFF